MKKIIIFVLMYISTQLGAKPLMLDNLNIERLGAILVQEKVKEKAYDEDTLALWTLQYDYANKYQNTRNDEFEFEDAKIWALSSFKTELNKVEKFDENQLFTFNLNASMESYDFKENLFPVNALTSDSYINIRGSGRFTYNGTLVFDNATSDINHIPMIKEKAKAFIKSRKRNGHIDRSLSASYIFTIKGYKEKSPFIPGKNTMQLEVLATLKSVEFKNSKTGKVIWQANYADTQEKNTTKENK